MEEELAMRTLEDLMRARTRSSMEPVQQVITLPDKLAPQEEERESFSATPGLRDDYLAAERALAAFARGKSQMSHELMVLILDTSCIPIGPFDLDREDPLAPYWETWIRFAAPDWIGTLLKILEEGEVSPTPQEEAMGFEFGIWWNTFQLFFWDVAERFPHDALAKLRPFLAHPDANKRQIARELAEEIEAQMLPNAPGCEEGGR